MNLKLKEKLIIILGKYVKSRIIHEKIIKICDRQPKSEEILLVKINSLSILEKNYKTLECVSELVKINPYNPQVLTILIKHKL